MIVKNEEDNISRCLNSVKDLFDEIIIVDTGSTDKTKKIAKQYTNKIYDFEWVNDFSKARNYSFSKAKMDYIMWLDADDIIPKKELKKLLKLKESLDKNIDIYMLKYNIGFDELGNCNFSYYRERIVKNNKIHKWNDRVHEYISLKGKIDYQEIYIEHKKNYTFSDRNLKIYEEMENNKEIFNPRNEYYYARELVTHKNYKKAIKYLKRFLKNNLGWIEDNINACELLYNCYRLSGDQKAVRYLYKSFEYGLPRSKTCYIIGQDYQSKNLFDEAIFWYTLAIISSKNKVKGFYEKDYDEFFPLLNLVVCYDKSGKMHEAKACHEITKTIKPKHPSVVNNEKYFEKIS